MKLTLLPLKEDDLLRVRCEGLVSSRAAEPLQELLGPKCFAHKVLLNLDRALGIDTSGINWLMQSHKRFQAAGGRLVLHGVPLVVLDVLGFLHLTPLLHIAPTEQEAGDLAENDSTSRPLDGQRPGPTVLFPR